MHAFRKVSASALTALTLSAAGVVVGASPAAAVPQLCEHATLPGTSFVSGFHAVKCSGGSGRYEAVASCSQTPSGSLRQTAYGHDERVGSGNWSIAVCPEGWRYLRNWWTNYYNN